MDLGRIHALVVATKGGGHVIYERYYDRYTELDKAEIRAAFSQASAQINLANDGQDFVGSFRGGCFVFIPTTDLVFYALGSGEYDEMALSGVLRVVMMAIADSLGKPPTESVLFEKYGRVAVIVDEVITEGQLEAIDRDAIRRGAKGKVNWE